MATNTLFNVNPRDWTAEDAGFAPGDGRVFYYHSHPDYDGIVHVIGDGVTAFSSLDVYYAPWQKEVSTLSFPTSSTFPLPRIWTRKQNDDTLRVSVSWPDYPLSTATGVTLNALSGATLTNRSGGVSATLTGYTESAPIIDYSAKVVYFSLTQTGAFASFDANSIGGIVASGGGASIVLS